MNSGVSGLMNTSNGFSMTHQDSSGTGTGLLIAAGALQNQNISPGVNLSIYFKLLSDLIFFLLIIQIKVKRAKARLE